jgi:hypothetical protein
MLAKLIPKHRWRARHRRLHHRFVLCVIGLLYLIKDRCLLILGHSNFGNSDIPNFHCDFLLFPFWTWHTRILKIVNPTRIKKWTRTMLQMANLSQYFRIFIHKEVNVRRSLKSRKTFLWKVEEKKGENSNRAHINPAQAIGLSRIPFNQTITS